MRTEDRRKRRELAYGAIFLAFGYLLFALARVSPLSDIGLYCLVSLCLALDLSLFGRRAALTLYLALVAGSFFILAPFMNFAFVCFFGPWPILISFLADLPCARHTLPRTALKVLFAGVLLLLFLSFFFTLFPQDLRARITELPRLRLRESGLSSFLIPLLLIFYYCCVFIYDFALHRLLFFARDKLALLFPYEEEKAKRK